jgi:UDP:flavonoid glycosyltransferase YjiC (YdhE family)
MRVLVATTANDGHFGPLVPLARACVAAGHEVRVAAPASYAAAVERAGFAHEPFGDAPPELIGPVMGSLPSLPFDEADAVVIREVFGRIDAQAALPGVAASIATWRPDVVLREPAELGSLAAAAAAGVPQVQASIGMQEMLRRMTRLSAEPLVELGGLAGLPGGRLEEVLALSPVVSLVPESLDRAGDTDYEEYDVLRCRDVPPAADDTWLLSWGDEPLVYVTFGTVAGSLPPFAGVFRQALDALADLPAQVLMTVGRRFDVASLGALPPNAHVESFVPQAAVLARAAAVVGHGGFGTTMGALTAGRPQVVVPLFASDQPINGRHVAATGAGRTLPPGPGTVAALPELLPPALTTVLEDASYAAAAEALARDVAALPPVFEAVAVLERASGSNQGRA